MRSICFLAVALLVSCAPVHASVADQIAAVDARLQTCIKRDEGMVGLKICTGEAHEAADKLLGSIYQAIVLKLRHSSPDGDADADRETLRRLVTAERAWIVFRDAECDLQGTQMLGGSGEGLAIGSCLLSLTKQRAKDLDDLFNN